MESKTVSQLTHSNIKFGLDLLKMIADTNKTENIFFSPFSIQAVMAMLHLGSKNNSKAEIEKTLHFDAGSIHGSLKEYLLLLNQPDSNFSLSSANCVFINNKFSFLENYLQQLRDIFQADAQTCDFGGDPEGEKNKINKWVEGETQSKIKDLVPSGLFNSLTAMVLINAIYLKGKWDTPFVTYDTVQGQFHIDKSEHVQVQMMNMETTLRYGNSDVLCCSVVELPYVKKDLSMFILLPHQVDGVTSLEANLTPDGLQQLLKEMQQEAVDISLPKFKLESSVDLKKMLQNLGLSDIFSEQDADLSGVDGTKDLYVSDALHKAFVEVNEEGTEAAAATGMVCKVMCGYLHVKPFNADHPFLFFIQDNRSDVILFWGKLNKPEGEVINTTTQ